MPNRLHLNTYYKKTIKTSNKKKKKKSTNLIIHNIYTQCSSVFILLKVKKILYDNYNQTNLGNSFCHIDQLTSCFRFRVKCLKTITQTSNPYNPGGKKCIPKLHLVFALSPTQSINLP